MFILIMKTLYASFSVVGFHLLTIHLFGMKILEGKDVIKLMSKV